MNDVVQLYMSGHPPQTKSMAELCMTFAEMALKAIEQEPESPFSSKLYLLRNLSSAQDEPRQDETRQDVPRQDETRQDETRQDETRQDETRQDKLPQDELPHNNLPDNLPASLAPLGQMDIKNGGSAAILQRASNLEIPNLAVVAQNQLSRFFFIALPQNCDWPVVNPRPYHAIDDECDELTSRWLAFLYETTLAVKEPVYQEGTITLHQSKIIPFKRLIIPVAPFAERPANHRLISATISPADPTITLI